jgi:hypothetical protein
MLCLLVMPGLDPGIHDDAPLEKTDERRKRGISSWIAGSSPAMTN